MPERTEHSSKLRYHPIGDTPTLATAISTVQPLCSLKENRRNHAGSPRAPRLFRSSKRSPSAYLLTSHALAPVTAVGNESPYMGTSSGGGAATCAADFGADRKARPVPPGLPMVDEEVHGVVADLDGARPSARFGAGPIPSRRAAAASAGRAKPAALRLDVDLDLVRDAARRTGAGRRLAPFPAATAATERAACGASRGHWLGRRRGTAARPSTRNW